MSTPGTHSFHPADAAGPSADLAPAFLAAGGEMAALMRQLDWGQTPLGPVQTWPQSLRTVVNLILNSRYAMFVWWGRQLVNLYNDAYRPFLGKKHPEALGLPAADVWSEIWDQIGPRTAAVLDRGESTFDEALLLPMDRYGYLEETYFTFSYSPINDDSGGIGGIFCAVTEETQRVIGERRLKLLRDVGAAMSEVHSPDDVCRAATASAAAEPHDLPFVLLYLTENEGRTARLAAQTQDSLDDSVAQPMIDLASNDSVWPLLQAATANEMVVVENLQSIADALPTGAWDRPPVAAVVMPLAAQGQGGAAGFLVAGLNPYRSFDESYRGFVSLLGGQIAAAIASARAYEAERRRAEALAEIDRAKTAFFSNVSHEFRTPLTLMLGPLEDTLNDASGEGLPAPHRARLETAHRNSLRLLRLVNSLLDFSRIEAGRIQANYVPTDLAGLTTHLAANFRSATDRAGLALEVDCPTLPQPVHVDPDMWEKLVLNLLSNAFKFTFDGGIQVTLHASDGNAVLTVRDTGVGIPPHELPRLFERFHRIEGQKSRSFEGSGIGLALVQELVRLHGGTIAAQSTVGAGTAFTVTIPLGTAHLPADRIVPAPLEPGALQHSAAFIEETLRWLPDERSGHLTAIDADADASLRLPDGSRPLVLVADDNADMRDYVSHLLQRSCDVIAFADGQAALDAIRERRPDLVLSDVMMPSLDGFALLRAVRADPGLRDLPIILLSARAGEEARAEGLESGADDYLIKPFSARELLARVGANLQLARLRREATLAALDSAERLQQLFARAPSFMCLLRGPEFEFELTNAAFSEIIGGRDVTGMPFAEALPELVQQGVLQRLLHVHATGETYTGRSERYVLAAAGGMVEKFLDVVYQPVRDAGGAVQAIFIEGSDVTERVRAEAALRETNEQLEARVADRTAELQQALEHLRTEIEERERAEEALRQVQKMEAIGQLTGGVAHDFNNLLTAISGGAETLIRLLPADLGNDTPRIQRSLQMVQEGARRAATLTQRLLAFARRQALAPQPLDANRLVAGMSELLHRTLGESIAIESVLAAGLWRTLADPNQLENALLNLAVNARDAMPAGGRLTIETANMILNDAYAAQHPEVMAGPYVMIAVADTGCGMTKETMEHVFEPFFTTKEAGQGTGLGLSQVYGFIKQSNGHVSIYSEPGQGTVVKLYLPRLAADAAVDAEPQMPVAAAPAGEGELILVVEDDEAVRGYSTDTLMELGYRLLVASNGPAGLELLARNPAIRLLFTDVGLPGGMTGRQLANAARRLRPDLPVLFTTGYSRNAIVHGGILDPDTHVLPKPFTYAALAAKIRSLLDA